MLWCGVSPQCDRTATPLILRRTFGGRPPVEQRIRLQRPLDLFNVVLACRFTDEQALGLHCQDGGDRDQQRADGDGGDGVEDR